MLAIVDIAGKQYMVKPNDQVIVDKVEGKPGTTISFDRVLLTSDEKTVKVGSPTVSGMSVKAKILEHIKGDKLHVSRFKSKVRYRKSIGFRPQYCRLEILTISHA